MFNLLVVGLIVLWCLLFGNWCFWCVLSVCVLLTCRFASRDFWVCSLLVVLFSLWLLGFWCCDAFRFGLMGLLFWCVFCCCLVMGCRIGFSGWLGFWFGFGFDLIVDGLVAFVLLILCLIYFKVFGYLWFWFDIVNVD